MTTKEEKYERKRRLMNLGIRDYPNFSEPKQGQSTPYRIAHACFECRKSYKIVVEYFNHSDNHKCPQCGCKIKYMGRSFKTPKQSDIKQWEKVKKLHEAGFLFFSYSSFPDAEALPDKLQEVDDFIARNPNHPMRVS